jgi:ribonuclease R
MERKAMEAERAANKYKQVEYMQQFLGEEFDGVVSGVAHFGFWVETVDTKCEGLVSIHNMTAKDEFVYDETEYALIGQYTGKKIRIGDRVKIRVVAANLVKRQLDYDLIEDWGDGPDVASRPQFRRKAADDTRRGTSRKQSGGKKPSGDRRSSSGDRKPSGDRRSSSGERKSSSGEKKSSGGRSKPSTGKPKRKND